MAWTLAYRYNWWGVGFFVFSSELWKCSCHGMFSIKVGVVLQVVPVRSERDPNSTSTAWKSDNATAAPASVEKQARLDIPA